MKKLLFVFTVALMSVTGVVTAHATIVSITSPGALGANDYVNWGTVGVEYTTIDTPFSVTSNGGINIGVSDPNMAGNFELLTQGSGWGGNFNPGDKLLSTTGNPGPIILSFSNPVAGAGTQIQSNNADSFTAEIEALGATGNILASYDFTGNSTGAGDGSAIFIGLLSDSDNIDAISFNVLSVQSGLTDFAINQADLVSLGTSAVPEPATVSLLGLGALGLFFRRKKVV